MKLWWHKLRHWEYWSVKIVYAPAFLVWLWFALKYRSFSFYKYVNPGIKNGGLHSDSKAEIYKLLPAGLYPKTMLVQINKDNDFNSMIQNHCLAFPFIVKPDIGYRGISVEKVYTIEELQRYNNEIRRNFLIQEVCNFPNEIGLFYCRMPQEKKGKLTGITIKRFLTVTGNGIDTLEQLLKNSARFTMQIPILQKQISLSVILPFGEKKCLVPFGNHNRGTEFIDGKEFISEKLEQTFDDILKNIKGFYYGRLDIRYNTFEELEEGKNFSIIELNGAKSEPTHIYDHKHSFWYGQKEIFKHQMIFQRIVKENILAQPMI